MKCPLERAYCPICGSDINFKKSSKEFCNCKKCIWICPGECEKNEDTKKNKDCK